MLHVRFVSHTTQIFSYINIIHIICSNTQTEYNRRGVMSYSQTHGFRRPRPYICSSLFHKTTSTSIEEDRLETMTLVILIKQNLQLLQFVLTVDLHLHHHVHALLLRDEQLRDQPEVVPVLEEAHRRPLPARKSVAERHPVLAPSGQCDSDMG